MGLNAGNVYIGIKGDLNPLDAALKAARRQSDIASRKIKSAFEKMEGAAKRTAKAITTGLGGAISGLAVGALITQAIKLADTYIQLEGRLRLVVDSAEDLVKVQKELYRQSQETGTSYEANVDLFTRLARSTKNLQISQEDVLKVTEALNKSIVVSGASSIEASNALIQLSQGLASNRLGGEELRSVMEQIPRAAQMIADGLGVDIGKFREMSKQGLLTTEVVTKALLAQADVIDAEFARMPMTINRAWVMITNSVGMAINKINESTGVTNMLALAMAWLSKTIDDNIDGITKFLKVTISGLEHLAKIVAVGGAIYMLPIIITKAHEAFATLFKLQAGVTGFNTALFGTSVSARLAEGSLSKMQLAGMALSAFFVGWELGKWANENFEEVRFAGFYAARALDRIWIEFKFSFEQLWLDAVFSAKYHLNLLPDFVADIFDKIAEKMSGASFIVKNPFGEDFQVGLDSVSGKFKDVAKNIRDSSSATEEYAKKTGNLNERYQKAIEIHNMTVDSMIKEQAWTKSVTESVDEAAVSQNDYSQIVSESNNVIVTSTTATAEAVMSAHGKMYDDLGEMGTEYQDFLFDQLDAQYAKYEEIGVNSLLLDKWYFAEREKIQKKFAKESITLQGAIAEATSKSAEAGALAWMRGEDAKTSASKIAADILTRNALEAAEKPLRMGLGQLLGEQVGAWVGLGAGESAAEGDSWMDRIKNGAMYLAQAAGIVLAGKAVGSSFYATGGWITRNKNGGPVNEGSGIRDDVFAGYTTSRSGDITRNMIQGGEFVVNRRSAQKPKNRAALELINADRFFADGGDTGYEENAYTDLPAGWEDYVRPPSRKGGANKWDNRPDIGGSTSMTVAPEKIWDTTKNLNDGAMSTFAFELIGSGFNWGEATLQTLYYYLTSLGTMIAGKEVGKHFFAEGGEVANYSVGGVLGEVVSKILDLFGWDFDDIWDFVRDLPIVSKFVDILDKGLFTFVSDIATPGGGADKSGPGSTMSNGFDNIVDSILDSLWDLINPVNVIKDLLGFQYGGMIGSMAGVPIYHDGTNFVSNTGPSITARGERIFSAPENQEIIDILRNGGRGNGNVNVNVYPSFKVMIGDEDFTDKVEIITENVIVEREDRGLIGTGERVRF